MRAKRLAENVIHGWFLLMGLVTVGCVLLISVYLIVSGIPAIREIGLVKFLFGPVWDSNGAQPQFGILPFILTSVYGTAGAILLGVPVGFMTAVFLAKMAPPKLKAAVSAAVSLLAGIPSVVYGLVGMLVLVPGIRRIFHIPDGSGLLAAIIVLAIMILPSIINVAMTALEAVPKEYEDASLALGATATETWFRVSVPAARGGGAGRRPRHRRGHGGDDGVRQRAEYAVSFPERAVFDHRRGQRDELRGGGLAAAGVVFHRAGAVPLYHAHQRGAEFLPQAQ